MSCRNNLQSLCYSEPIALKVQNLHRRGIASDEELPLHQLHVTVSGQ